MSVPNKSWSTKLSLSENLAFKSVDSLVGKIRALFRDEGRSGEWNPMLLTGNPAASHILKKLLQAVTQEQVNAKVSIKQATPLMFSKLGQLCRHLSCRVFAEEDSLTRFLFARDLAYFSILCHSGSRGGGLGLVTADRCFDIPGSEGILISQVEGKVATLDNPKNCIIIPSKDNEICPIKTFENTSRWLWSQISTSMKGTFSVLKIENHARLSMNQSHHLA